MANSATLDRLNQLALQERKAGNDEVALLIFEKVIETGSTLLARNAERQAEIDRAMAESATRWGRESFLPAHQIEPVRESDESYFGVADLFRKRGAL